MNIVQIDNTERDKFMDLLLIADEQESMINKYLYRGKMFSLYDNGLKAVCIVTEEDNRVFEIKNIATNPNYQRMGYGQKLIFYLFDYYKGLGTTMLVGTGDSPMTIDFYQKCGFVYSHLVKNFFVDNYDHPIFENGNQLIDMIYLKKNL
ncbi:putative N-acetyltransferase YvbK [Sporomusa rhizae]|uniref:GNAT family N-acetyltransferase n=1 Tax=Sporomusa rhizae TaxID=357999 RepID=UPI00352B6CDA